MSELKTSFYRAFFWNFFNKIFSYLTTFIISVILARLLEPSEFGTVAMVWVIVIFAQIFIDTGLSTALVQKQDVSDIHYGSVLFFNIFVGLVLSIAFFLSAPVIADFYNNQLLIPIVKALSISFLLSSFGRVQAAWLTKQLNFKKQTYISIISQVCGGCVGVYLAFNNYGIWAIVCQNIVSSAINPICFYFLTGWRPKLIFSFNALKELWGFGFRMFISGLLSSIASLVDEIIIGKIFTPQALGFYNRGKSLTKITVQYTFAALAIVFLPSFSKIQNDAIAYKKSCLKALKILSFLSFPLIGLLFLLSEDIIIILFTKKWEASIIFFQLILIAYTVYPNSALLVNIIAAKGNSKSFLKLEIIKQSMSFICLVVGFYFGIKEYLFGAIGVSAFAFIINIIFAAKEISEKARTLMKINGTYLLLTLIITILLWYIGSFFNLSYWNHALIFGFTFITLYLLFSYIFRLDGFVYFYEEIRTLIKPIKNGENNSN